MKDVNSILEMLRKNKPQLAKDYGLVNIGVFGSYVRAEQTENSDVDILIELSVPVGLISILKLKHTLEDIIGSRVDVVSRKALKPYIGARILKEVRYA
ncbi:MAG TPA: nucleotidyltransferase [Nitrospiraceae bacterium]|nr:MAG: nucleotidyltransferase [Nitrospirae bacterium GWA2_46_11]OGW24444.1 MAG: nucleotidyltransferase [Nitrospirae bacterium GWB2_47_37]HAK89476.1 nucleotidyltransferase [Nitrospiraceae bacterium]HCD37885.1 nucleotidyltransferase [Candidatus Omnitrophota bacterium]HCZ10800.1 nucleotidyltransferase [Nitrospiraceae bacterium]